MKAEAKSNTERTQLCKLIGNITMAMMTYIDQLRVIDSQTRG